MKGDRRLTPRGNHVDGPICFYLERESRTSPIASQGQGNGGHLLRPEEIHGLLGYCQHMIDLMARIIRNR